MTDHNKYSPNEKIEIPQELLKCDTGALSKQMLLEK